MKMKTIAAILLGAATLAAAPVLPVSRGIWQDNAVTAEAATTNNWYYYTTGSYNTSSVTYRLDTQNKKAYVYSASGKSGTLAIPATVNYVSVNYPIVGIDSYAFQNYTALLTLDLTGATNMTSLGGYAFTKSTISTVKLGGANLTIRQNAFRDAASLRTVEFKNNNKTLTVEKYAFANSGLRYFNFYGKTLTAKSYSFDHTNNMYQLYLNSKTDSVTIETSAFAYSGISFLNAYCRSITIKSQAFENATDTFKSSSNLTYVDFNRDVQEIKLADSAFAGLWALKTVSFYNPSVSLTMGKRMFASSTVKTVNFPNSMTVIPESCFERCTLTSSPITCYIKEIKSDAFARATLPASVTIPSSLTTIADTAFANIYGVKEYTIPNGNAKFKLSGGGLYTSDLKRLISYPPERTATSVTIPASTIPDGTIANNPYIKSLNIQKYVRRNTSTVVDTADFSGLTSVRSLFIPSSDWNNSSLTGEQLLFRYKSFLGSVNEINGYRIVQQPSNGEPTFYSKFNSYIRANFDKLENDYCAYFMEEYADAMASYVVNQVTTPSMSAVQKAVRLHQWICKRTTYNPKTIANDDYNDPKDHTETSVFLHKETYNGKTQYVTVCEGYARCYRRLMKKAGIEAQYVHGGGHAWNIVKISGKWYHVDVTWDDEQFDERNSNFKKSNRYKYFLCSDAIINKDHGKWNSTDDSSLNSDTNVATDDNYYRLGDVYSDNAYNSKDQNVFDNIANGTTPSSMQKVRGDLNFDGKVNGTDRDLFNKYINSYQSTYSRPALWRFTTLEK